MYVTRANRHRKSMFLFHGGIPIGQWGPSFGQFWHLMKLKQEGGLECFLHLQHSTT